MISAIKKCDRCSEYTNTEVYGDCFIDGSEYGFDMVCNGCMRILENQCSGEEHHWLDIMRYCIHVSISGNVELLETSSQPRWYFVRVKGVIVFEGEKTAAKGMYQHYTIEAIAEDQFKRSALYRLANGSK